MPAKSAGLIVIGDEVLKGEVADCNIPFLAKKLHSLGIKLCKVCIIPDDVEIIAREVAQYSVLYDQVITSGGIGPTHDDVTYKAVSEAFSQPLVVKDELVTYWSWFNEDPPTGPRRCSTLKMATIPRDSVIIYANLPSRLIPEEKFPVITVNNVCILPGLPKYLRAIFNALEGVYFRPSGLEFHNRRLYLSVFESVFAEYLNETVEKFPDVTFGSYPKLNNPYYKTIITLESHQEKLLEEALIFFQSRLNKSWVAVKGDILGDAWIRTEELLDSDDPSLSALTSSLNESIEILNNCLNDHHPAEIFISFNGGKDCTVLVHLVHSLMIKRFNAKDFPKLNAVYIRTEDPFEEVEDFIYETADRYNLSLITENGPLQKGIQNVMKNKKLFKVAILGTRRSDPRAKDLSHIQTTDKGWGNLLRVSPLLDWSYKDVWTYLRELQVPYCSLYDMGYTSLGSKISSSPNPALEFVDTDGTTKYRPAYCLEEENKERVGRT